MINWNLMYFKDVDWSKKHRIVRSLHGGIETWIQFRECEYTHSGYTCSIDKKLIYDDYNSSNTSSFFPNEEAVISGEEARFEVATGLFLGLMKSDTRERYLKNIGEVFNSQPSLKKWFFHAVFKEGEA